MKDNSLVSNLMTLCKTNGNVLRNTATPLAKKTIQYVAQYPDGTSIRPLKTKTQFLRRPFPFSVNEVFRMKAEHFSIKMKVLASLKLAKQSQKTPFCSDVGTEHEEIRLNSSVTFDGQIEVPSPFFFFF